MAKQTKETHRLVILLGRLSEGTCDCEQWDAPGSDNIMMHCNDVDDDVTCLHPHCRPA